MEMEESIFRHKRFDADSMLRFGFHKTDNGFMYVSGFMNGDFTAQIFVSDGGRITGRVIDNMNGEEYAQLRMESCQGAYIGSVREAYTELLGHIAKECCDDVPFVSDQANRIAKLIRMRYSVVPDNPWEDDDDTNPGVFRHSDTLKWFALIMNVKRHAILKNGDAGTVDVINLKADTSKTDILTEKEGIYPAYHMNHKHWISVFLDDELTDDDVMSLIDESFRLTGRHSDRKK